MNKAMLFLAAGAMLVSSAARAEDWPMLAHDPARSGGTTDGIDLPVRRAWVRYFQMDGLMSSVQPVVVGGRVYFGTLSGKFFCVDAATGEDVWVAEVGAPVFHTACHAGDVVVFGCGDGVVRALKVASGLPAWSHPTGAPLWNAPLAHDGRVYIGGRDGVFYCLNAADGKPVWTHDAKAPICQSPAMDVGRGVVYFTAESMRVFAINAASGKLKWRSEPINGVTARSFYPVVAPDGTVLATAIPWYSWDRAHQPLNKTLETLFGTEKLESADDTKYPGTYTRLPDWRLTQKTKDRYSRLARSIMLQEDYFDRLVAELTRRIDADPASRCLFLLDPETGKQKVTVPVAYTAFAKSAFIPPVVTGDGRIITKWWALLPSTFGAYQREVNIAYLDTGTGKLTPVFDESRVNSGLEFRLIADESCQLSIAGARLLNLGNHHGEVLKSFDLSDPKRAGVADVYQTHSHWYGVGIIHRILRDQLDEIYPGQEDLTRYFGVFSEASTGNQMSANMPVVVSDGRLFWMQANKLMVLVPADKPPAYKKADFIADFGIEPLTDAELKTLHDTWPINWDFAEVAPPDGNWGDHKVHTPARVQYPKGTRQNPDTDAGQAAEKVADARLDRYIFEALSPGELPDTPAVRELRDKLAAAVGELVSRPLWMPYRFEGGKHPNDYLDFFTDPADQLEALAWAYPFVDTELKEKVRQYVQAEWTKSNPVVMSRAYETGKGEPRERYAVPADRGRVYSLTRDRGLSRAYAAWLWGHASGDWETVRQIWPALRTTYRNAKDDARFDAANSYCSGLIALCRLARRFGDDETLAQVLPVARRQLRQRLATELTYHEGFVAADQIGLWRGFVRWSWMTPEVGRMLRTEAPSVAGRIVQTYLDRLRPTWYLVWGPITPASREVTMQIPSNPMTGFLAQAFIADAPAVKLAGWTDIPACKADPYYIQKLAITLGAHAKGQWRAEP